MNRQGMIPQAANDVVINKIQSLQRCVSRARETYHDAQDSFATDYLHQDAAILNVIRACEQAIDLANYTIKRYKLGIPTSSAESFELLTQAQIIDRDLLKKMKGMVGFRNLAVHQYTELDLDIVEAILTTELDDLLLFADIILAFLTQTTRANDRKP